MANTGGYMLLLYAQGYLALVKCFHALCKKASNHHANHTPGNVQFYIVTSWETPGNHWC